MLKSIILSLLCTAIASAAPAGNFPAKKATAPEARFTVNSIPSLIDIDVDIDDNQVGQIAAEVTTGKLENGISPIIRWVILPDHGNASVEVTSVNAKLVEGTTNRVSSEALPDDIADRIALLGKPQIMRGVRLAPVSIESMVNGEDGDRWIIDDLSLVVHFNGGAGENEVIRPVAMNRQFASALKDLTLNPPQDLPGRDLSSANQGRMLILKPSTLQNQGALDRINTFKGWKEQQGYEVTVTTVDFEEIDPIFIRDNIIAEGYPDNPYDYVLIIGWFYDFQNAIRPQASLRFPAFSDPNNQLRTMGDLSYVTLDGDDDWLPDIAIGRMVAHHPDSLQAMLNRSIRYEQDPYPGPQGEEGDWYSRTIYAIDYVDDEIQIKQSDLEMKAWALQRLERDGFSVSYFQGNRQQVKQPERDALNEGVSLAFGDGYLFGMIDSVNQNGWRRAVTGRKHPFIVTCPYYYEFPYLFPFFNAGTVNDPQGPIAAVGAPGEHWFIETRDAIGGAMRQLAYGEDHTTSTIWFASCLSILGRLNVINPENEELINSFFSNYSYNLLLGDPSLKINTVLPEILHTDLPNTLNPGGTLLAFTVLNSGNEPVPAAEVFVRQEGNFQLFQMTDADGKVFFTIEDGLSEDDVQITIGKQNCKTLLLTKAVEYPQINLELTAWSLNPEELINGQSSALSLTFENSGEDDATNLSVEFGSDSPFLSFTRNPARLIDIDSGSNGGLSEAVRLVLSPSCPGGEVIQVTMTVSSGQNHWDAAFDLTTVGPRYTTPDDEVVYNNLARGAQGTVAPRLHNIGDADGVALQATLVSLTPEVHIIEANRNYDALNVGGAAGPGSAFRVSVDNNFIRGQVAEFELRLTGEGNFSTSTFFSTTIGQPNTDDPTGPDEYGYYAFDSGDEGWVERPFYRWYEINPSSEAGADFQETKLNLPDALENAGSSTLIDLPFAFNFYGETYDQLVVCSNGWVSFDPEAVDFISNYAQPIPGYAAPDAQIAICWQDLFNVNGVHNGVYTYHMEESGLFIIEWSEIEQEPLSNDSASFQIVLFNPETYPTETEDGVIEFHYKRFQLTPGRGVLHFPTIGIRSADGSSGLQYRHGYYYDETANEIGNEFAIRFVTSRQREAGRLTGRIVRAEDQNVGIDDVVINHPAGINAVTANGGRFDLVIPPGRFDRLSFSKRYFSTIYRNIDVEPSELVELNNVPMPHPEFAELPERVDQSLQPGLPGDFPLFFRNRGNGPLDYRSTIVHTNGSYPSYDTLKTYRIAQILGNDRTSTMPFWMDGHFYIPANSGGTPSIKVMDRQGNLTGEVIPQPHRDSTETSTISLTHDGENFWGTYRLLAGGELIDRVTCFNANGQVLRIFNRPEELNNQNWPSVITFSESRQSLFMATKEVSRIVEVSINANDTANFGRVINSWEMVLPGEQFLPFGLGWNSADVDQMPLYILDEHYQIVTDSIRHQRVIKFNPETGDWKIMAYLRNIIAPADPQDHLSNRINYGIAIMPDYSNEHMAVAIAENANPSNDMIKVYTIGPNTSFISGNLIRQSGTVPAATQGFITIPFHAADLDTGVYSFGLKIFHNAIGDSAFVPIYLDIDSAGYVIGDKSLLPGDFGISKVYPNPFNATLGIDYTAPQGEFISLKVFDLSGRQVATIFEGTSAGTSNKLVWNALNQSAGVYFLQLESPGATAVRKVQLIK